MIKKLFEKVREAVFGRDYELRERIFRMIIIVGSILVIMGIVECIFLMDVMTILIPLVMLLVLLCIEILATFKYRKIDFAAILVGCLIIMVVFPEMFFLSGGLEG